MYLNNKIIKIYFKKKPIYKNIDTIFLTPNKDLVYYDNSHLNYIYKLVENNIEYTFNGFFKDNYFVITFNAFNKEMNVNIHNNNIIIIKLEWVLKKVSENQSLWIINDEQFINYRSDALILPINNKLFTNNTINIDDYLKVTDNTRKEVIINCVDSINNNKTFSLRKIIFSFFNFNNEDF
jgi:hypothetical protein